MKRLLLSISALILVGTIACSKPDAEEDSTTASQDKPGYDLFLIEKTKEGVGAKLRDPESAVFADLHIGKARGKKIVCGTVNAANAFGGKGGKQRFVGVGEAAYLEEEGAEAVQQVWQEAGC